MTDPSSMKLSIKFLILSLLLVGCMNQPTDALKNSTEIATGGIGCKQLQSKMFDSMYAYLDQKKQVPNLDDLKFYISAKIDQIAVDQKIKDLETLEKYKNEFHQVFEIMINDSRSLDKNSDTKKLLQNLIEMEMQDETTETNIRLKLRMAQQMDRVNELSQKLDLN